MAELTTLLAEALQWRLPDTTHKGRERAYAEAYATLGETFAGQVLLHDLALRLMGVAVGNLDEGGRRFALDIFEKIAKAQSLREEYRRG